MDVLTQPLQNHSVSAMRTIVREIADFLSGPTHNLDGAVQSMWQNYCECCQQVNQRLDLCSQLLDRGEWLEAVRQTEMEPRVLECAAILDFEFRGTWEQICCENGWMRYVPVSMVACRRLSEARDNRQRLQSLLKSHLRLAISRAPLSQRLPVMRELARKDTLSTSWRDEILVMEKLRAPDLVREARSAIAANDVPALQALIDEFQSSPWLVKFPESARTTIDEAEQHVIRLRDLPELTGRLTRCFHGRDNSGGATAITDWKRLWERIRGFRRCTLNEVDIAETIGDAFIWASALPTAAESVSVEAEASKRQRQSRQASRTAADASRARTDTAADYDTSGELDDFEDAEFDPYVSRSRFSKRTIILAACLCAGLISLVAGVVLIVQTVW